MDTEQARKLEGALLGIRDQLVESLAGKDSARGLWLLDGIGKGLSLSEALEVFQLVREMKDDMSAEWISSLIGIEVWEVSMFAIEHPKTSTADLVKLSVDHLGYVLDLPNCPLEVMERAAQSERWSDAHRVAGVVKVLPVGILEKLSRNTQTGVRLTVAKRSDCTDEVVERLSRDVEFRVREAIAGRTDCPAEVLRRLSRDGSTQVRDAVAINSNTPEDALAFLIKSPRCLDKPSAIVNLVSKRASADDLLNLSLETLISVYGYNEEWAASECLEQRRATQHFSKLVKEIETAVTWADSPIMM